MPIFRNQKFGDISVILTANTTFDLEDLAKDGQEVVGSAAIKCISWSSNGVVLVKRGSNTINTLLNVGTHDFAGRGLAINNDRDQAITIEISGTGTVICKISKQATLANIPVLSAATFVSITDEGGIPRVTTSTAGGTLYYAILTESGSANNAEIRAGTGGNIIPGFTGNITPTGGVNSFDEVVGLTLGTAYRIVYLHDVGLFSSNQAVYDFETLGASDYLLSTEGDFINTEDGDRLILE